MAFTMNLEGGWIAYEGEAVQLQVLSVDTKHLEKHGKATITFVDKSGDKISNNYDIKNPKVSWMFSAHIKALYNGNIGKTIDMNDINGLVGKHAMFKIVATEPNEDGKVFYNIRGIKADPTPFGGDSELDYETSTDGTLDIKSDEMPF